MESKTGPRMIKLLETIDYLGKDLYMKVDVTSVLSNIEVKSGVVNPVRFLTIISGNDQAGMFETQLGLKLMYSEAVSMGVITFVISEVGIDKGVILLRFPESCMDLIYKFQRTMIPDLPLFSHNLIVNGDSKVKNKIKPMSIAISFTLFADAMDYTYIVDPERTLGVSLTATATGLNEKGETVSKGASFFNFLKKTGSAKGNNSDNENHEDSETLNKLFEENAALKLIDNTKVLVAANASPSSNVALAKRRSVTQQVTRVTYNPFPRSPVKTKSNS